MVTVLFIDLVDSTALGASLDPETLREVMGEYFTAVTDCVHRHRGMVEKFIGDAVLAVFGTPTVHEDDAARAVRAVLEVRAAVEELNTTLRPRAVQLRMRAGVNTGEVVLGPDRAGGSFATGDTVNVAARLEQAAGPGQILLGELTHELVAGQVRARELPAVAVKGKAQRVPAWHLEALAPASDAAGGLFVGREVELAQLRELLALAAQTRNPVAVTVVGEPGLGKTRLAQELASTLPGQWQVLRARCLSYGEGAALWPLREMLLQAAALDGHEGADRARAAFTDLVAGHPDAAAVAARLTSVTSATEAGPIPEDLGWAVRVFLEQVAARQPVLLLLDDAHWASPALTGLLGQALAEADGSPIAVVALARPELLEQAGTNWLPAAVAKTVQLEPLPPPATTRLVCALGVAEAEALRITRRCGGNALFAHQLAQHVGDRKASPDRADSQELPASITAVLSARLGLLEPQERQVLACAAVIGAVFYPAAVPALAGLTPDTVTQALTGLRERGWVQPCTADLPGQAALTFSHVLLRDVAYRELTKAARWRAHARLADWLVEQCGDGVPHEVVAAHLERACIYRQDLRAPQEDVNSLADRAAGHFQSAARRVERVDPSLSTALLARAAALPGRSEARLRMMTDLAAQLFELGRPAEAEPMLTEVTASGSVTATALAQAVGCIGDLALARRPVTDIEAAARSLLPVFEGSGDLLGQCYCYFALDLSAASQLRWTSVLAACEHAMDCAARAGDQALMSRLRANGSVFVCAATPVPEALRAVRQQLAAFPDDLRATAIGLTAMAELHAMAGEHRLARQLLEDGRRRLTDLRLQLRLANLAQTSGPVHELAGAIPEADQEYRASREALRRLPSWNGFLSTVAALHARMLIRAGRVGQARDALAEALDTATPEDAATELLVAHTSALLAVRAGDVEGAQAHLADAWAICAVAEFPNEEAETRAVAAQVALAGGDVGAARRYLRDGVAILERKGNVARAAALTASLQRLRSR